MGGRRLWDKSSPFSKLNGMALLPGRLLPEPHLVARCHTGSGQVVEGPTEQAACPLQVRRCRDHFLAKMAGEVVEE